MNPTSTEHDWRFPRRPIDHHHQQNHHPTHNGSRMLRPDRGSPFSSFAGNGNNSGNNNGNSTSNGNAKMHDAPADFELDFSAGARPPTAQEQFLNSSTFSRFGDLSMESEHQTEADMAKEDPLAAQVWKFFRQTKQNLPNQERMENLSWRMMALNLRKQKQQEEAARYGAARFCFSFPSAAR